MQSPRAKAKKQPLMAPKDFKERLDMHIRVDKELEKLKREAAASKEKKVVKEGQEYGAKRLGALRTQNLKQLAKLSTVYLRAHRRVRPARAGTANGGFRQPLVVGPELLEFFKRADLGRVGGKNDNSGPALQSVLTFLSDQPLASRSVLTSLFALYAKKHNLSAQARDNTVNGVPKPDVDQNHQLLSADRLMNETLGNLLGLLEKSSAAKLAGEGVADGQQKPAVTKAGHPRKYYKDQDLGTQTQPVWNSFYHAFHRDNFSYAYLQGIFSKGITPIGQAAASAQPPVPKETFLVTPPEVAKEYMRLVESAAEAGTLGRPGATFGDLARQASPAGVNGGLQLRAALDDMHARVALASATYTVERPKAKVVRKPKKK
jgi:hypothetical protein